MLLPWADMMREHLLFPPTKYVYISSLADLQTDTEQMYSGAHLLDDSLRHFLLMKSLTFIN